MSLGKRIKERRTELGLTVDDLAERLGKNRATVYRYENNEIENLPISVLQPLSQILKTTPSRLMGWDDVQKRANALESMVAVLQDIYDEVDIVDDEETGSYDVYLIKKGGPPIHLQEIPFENLYYSVQKIIPEFVSIIADNANKGIFDVMPMISGINEKGEYVESFAPDEIIEIINDLAGMPDEALGEFKAIAKYIRSKYAKD